MSEINEWYMNIQNIVDDIDRCIKSGEDEKTDAGQAVADAWLFGILCFKEIQRNIGNEAQGLYEIP